MGGYCYASGPAFHKGGGHPHALVDSLRTPSPAWDETARVGRRLFPVGRLLRAAQQDAGPAVVAATDSVTTANDRKRPAVETATWRLRDAILVLAVNNDLDRRRAATLTMPDGYDRAGLLQLLDVRMVQGGTAGVEIDLAPGDAAFLAVGSTGTLSEIAAELWRFRHEQETAIAQIDLDLAAAYGLAADGFQGALAAVKPGPAMYERFARLKADIHAALEEASRFVTRQKALARVRQSLSAAEAALEELHAQGAQATEAVAEWYGLVRVFGGLRYALYTNRPFDENAIESLDRAARSLLAAAREHEPFR
jgi:hypothetical protein